MMLPAAFEERMQSVLGVEYASFKQALEAESPVSVRVNQLKSAQKPNLERIPWCDSGYYLPHRPLFTVDPLFHAGGYYVQEASSMWLEQAVKSWVDLSSTRRALDLCAAPGGKSTHLRSLLPDDTLLISNEVIKSRAHILRENLSKWGHYNSLVTRMDPEQFAKWDGLFDLMVVDAPCSGEGLFRKDAEAMEEWSEANCHLCQGRQSRILHDVWPALREGGVLIYSTCTYNPAENEVLIRDFAREYDVEVLQLPLAAMEMGIMPKELDGVVYGYQCYPHQVKGEGFFIAGLRKLSGTVYSAKLKNKPNKLSTKDAAALHGILSSGDWGFYESQGQIWAYPEERLDLIAPLLPAAMQIGVPIGQLVHGKFNPAAELALSVHLNEDYFPTLEVEREDALLFLSRADFDVHAAQAGWNLITHNGLALGWIKKIGNRANNYWPQEWRIRMSPDKWRQAHAYSPLDAG